MTDTLIIPGLNGSSPEHWQRHWAADHPRSIVVEQDDWGCPVIGDWQEKLDGVLSRTDGAFLVAHSLGCLLVASYARRPLSQRIRGALLVAPCSLDAVLQMHPCIVGVGGPPHEPRPV